MKPTILPALGQISHRQWSALGSSMALGGLLVALLFIALRPGAASAAGAAVYSCDQTGLNNALAAGGPATFACGAPFTITVGARQLVSKNVSLDGGGKLILSGGNVTGVFTVAAGVHLSLLHLKFVNAKVSDFGGAIVNHGFLNIVSSQFISNLATGGAALFNASGATAVISDAVFEKNVAEGGAILNGEDSLTGTASLHVINSQFLSNVASFGAALYNFSGPVTVTGGEFDDNLAGSGGAIFDIGHLRVDDSQFFSNGAIGVGPLGPQPAARLPSGGSPPAGGALYVASSGNVVVGGSSFLGNFGQVAGGAVYFGEPLLLSQPSLAAGSLAILDTYFSFNCTDGAGGALMSLLPTFITDSTFINNGAFSDGCAFFADQRAPQPRLPAVLASPAGVLPVGGIGAGGAIFNGSALTVVGGAFLSNTATVTTAGGGGAINNYSGAQLLVAGARFSSNQAQQMGGAIFNNAGGVAAIGGSDFSQNRVLSNSGGALATLGLLTVTNSSFERNTAPGDGDRGGGGAIYVADTLAADGVANSSGPATPADDAPQGAFAPAFLFLDHGSFISNASAYEGGAIDGGHISIQRSTFLSNTAAWGGALNIWKPGLALTASTFIANAAVTTTLFGARQGGAIDSNNAPMTVVNSTFYINRGYGPTYGGALNNDSPGTVAITNSTFLSNTVEQAGRGGALSRAGTITLHNTLVAFSVGGDCNITVTLNGANLEYPGSTCGAASVIANPAALAPANNGGPTLTSALLPGSPAINSGDNSGCPTTDQRGVTRPVGGPCDIGAFEFGGLAARLWLPLLRH